MLALPVFGPNPTPENFEGFFPLELEENVEVMNHVPVFAIEFERLPFGRERKLRRLAECGRGFGKLLEMPADAQQNFAGKLGGGEIVRRPNRDVE